MASPQLWCGGPAHVFVGLGAGNSPVYLGTSEGAPSFQITPYFNRVKNDWAGDQAPFDMQYVGQTATVSCDFTRWDNSLWLEMLSRPNFLNTPGLNAGGDLGTFMVAEGFTYPLWLQNPYATAKTAMFGLEAGFRFLAAISTGPDTKTLGTRTMKARMQWFCTQNFTVGPSNTVLAQLYDNNMNGLPSIT